MSTVQVACEQQCVVHLSPPTKGHFVQLQSPAKRLHCFSMAGTVWSAIVALVLASCPNEAHGKQTSNSDFIELLKRRLEMDPSLAENWRMLGKYYLKSNNIADAISTLHRAIELDPNSAAAHFDLGQAYLANQKHDLATFHFQKVIALAPTSGYARELIDANLVDAPAEMLNQESALEVLANPNLIPASYQMQTFDGSDDLQQRSNHLEVDAHSKPQRVRAFLEAGSLYNSNVSLTPTSRELRSVRAASAQAFINPEFEWLLVSKGPLRAGPITRGYFTANEGHLSNFNLASFQGGMFAERDVTNGSNFVLGRFEYLYVLDLLAGKRFGNRHTITPSITSVRPDGGFYYIYGSVSFAQFADSGSNPTTDSLTGNTYTVGASRLYKTQLPVLRSCSVGADFESARTQGLDFRYNGISVHGSTNWSLSEKITFNPETGIGFRNYYAFTGAPSRDELIARCSTRLRYQHNSYWALSAIGSYDRFAAKNDAFDAQRVQAGLVSTFLY
ncbi:MAG: tetratricopeptide repeat protein [Pirellulales bacterium]